ncbi:hypothetical protein Tco_1119564 [Tanacetum coccineum]
MAFKNFLYAETNKDISFLSNKSSLNFGIGYLSFSINTNLHVIVVESTKKLVKNTANSGDSPRQEKLVIHPGSVAARIKDRKYSTGGGSLKPPVQRMLVYDASFRATRLPDVLDLQNANACHFKVFAITPPSWKNNLNNQLDVELLDLHDRCYARHVVVDNDVNRRAQELLKAKCEVAMADFDNNPAAKVLRDNIASLLVELETAKASLCQEVENVRHDRVELVSKVVPYVEIELVQSDDMDRLVVKLVSSAIFYGRCHAFEEVANMKEPFNITKVKGYRSSSKQEHIKAGNVFATATFPFLFDVVEDPYASVEALLSKKPQILQRPAPTRIQVPAYSVPS